MDLLELVVHYCQQHVGFDEKNRCCHDFCQTCLNDQCWYGFQRARVGYWSNTDIFYLGTALQCAQLCCTSLSKPWMSRLARRRGWHGCVTAWHLEIPLNKSHQSMRLRGRLDNKLMQQEKTHHYFYNPGTLGCKEHGALDFTCLFRRVMKTPVQMGFPTSNGPHGRSTK